MDPYNGVLSKAGIDTETGVKRLGGKRERYESLLRKFASKQADTVALIRESLSSDDTETAERTAHSLKGSASTLGANSLAETAASAEEAIKTKYGIDEALRSLAHALDETVAAIRTALPD